jgi:hypothetical protein
VLNPNNPIVKIFFLIGTWYLIFYPCYIFIKEILENFKQVKSHVKIIKIIGIMPFVFLISLLTFLWIERLIHFSWWHIGGSNL